MEAFYRLPMGLQRRTIPFTNQMTRIPGHGTMKGDEISFGQTDIQFPVGHVLFRLTFSYKPQSLDRAYSKTEI